jgi:two-component system, NarL family, response regulator NreC
LRIRILLIHSFRLFREGLKSLLENEADFCVVAEAADAIESLSLAEQHQPDVVVLEANMAGSNSIEAARELVRSIPSARVLFLSAISDEEAVVDCMHSGAAGLLPPESTVQEFTAAVRQIANGETYLPPAALSRFVDGWRVRSGKETQRNTELTRREREILKLLAEGHSVRACAALLSVSPKTVEAHKFNLMRKLNIHNKAQLVHYAFQKKIVRLSLVS